MMMGAPVMRRWRIGGCKMALPQRKINILPHSQERRRHQRVSVNLLGRFMLSDRQEHACQVINISPGGIALIAPVTGNPGERVIAYVDHLGRLEGVIARQIENGFAMTIAATPRRRDKLAAQLTWLANRTLGLPEDRRHGRITPRNPNAQLTLPNGVNVSCRLIDLSASGAAVKSDLRPELGTHIMLGKTSGRVVRHLDEGFAVEYTRLQHPDFLEENVTGA
jgi:PilZ domain-containing protein